MCQCLTCLSHHCIGQSQELCKETVEQITLIMCSQMSRMDHLDDMISILTIFYSL